MPSMEEFQQAVDKAPYDEELRQIYADWLDENDLHEEATKQREYLPALSRLKKIAIDNVGYFVPGRLDYWDQDEKTRIGTLNKEDLKHGQLYADMMYFLRKQSTGEFRIGFDAGIDFHEFTKEIWQDFEIVTGLKSPENWKEGHHQFRCCW